MTDDTLNQMGQYLIWSEKKLMEMIKKIPVEKFEEENAIFGRSMKDLANHIWLSYKGYFLGFGSEEYGNLEKRSRDLSKNDLFKIWLAATEEFATAIAKEKDTYEYPISDDKKVEINMISNIMQYTDHSTYHRGQLIVQIKTSGFEVSSTDYYLFLEEFLKDKN